MLYSKQQEHLVAITAHLHIWAWGPIPSVTLQAAIETEAQEYTSSMNREGGWALLCCSAASHLQGSSVARWAAALPRDVIAGSSVLALASLVTVVTIRALLTALLAAPAPEACSTVASPCDGVAQSPVFALAPAAAVRPPVITVAG